MHPNPTALRVGATLAIFRILAVGATTLTGIAALTFNEHLLLPALILVTLSVLLIVASFVVSAAVKCTYCRSQLFAPLSLPKHPNAKAFLGSHLIEMSLDILLGTSFRCMYCGERCGCRHTSEGHRRPSSTSVAKQRIRPSNPSNRTIATILSRDPAAATHAPRYATHVPQVSPTRAPAAAHSPQTPRAPYSNPQEMSTSAFDTFLPQAYPARASQPHHYQTGPTMVA